jgi:hypothetical protein
VPACVLNPCDWISFRTALDVRILKGWVIPRTGWQLMALGAVTLINQPNSPHISSTERVLVSDTRRNLWRRGPEVSRLFAPNCADNIDCPLYYSTGEVAAPGRRYCTARVRFAVLTSVKMSILVVWVVTTWRRKQYVTPKHYYLLTCPYSVTAWKSSI